MNTMLKVVIIGLGVILAGLGTILFFVKNGPQYDNTITGRGISQQSTQRGAPDPTYENMVTDGYMFKVVEKNGSISYYDSTVSVQRTWNGAWIQGKTDGSQSRFIWGYVIALGLILLFIALSLFTKAGEWLVALPVIAILVGGPLMGSGFQWNKWNSDRVMFKGNYVEYTTTGSKLVDDRFWSLPAKAL